MSKYHKILAVLILLAVVFGAGCSSKDSETDAQSADAGFKDKVSAEKQVRAGELTNADIDPALAGLMIVNDNPDITVTGVKINDIREFEADVDNYEIVVSYRNDGEQPVWNDCYFGQQTVDGDYKYRILESGMTQSKYFRLKFTGYGLDNLPSVHIMSRATVMPEISANLTNFQFNMTNMRRSVYDNGRRVDVHSISYVVDESRGWKSVVMDVSASGDQDVQAEFHFTPMYMERDKMDMKVTIPAGQTVKVTMPLKSTNANNIWCLSIRAFVPS